MELRHFAALAAIERTGSFRGAADELGYVQSAISQQIARLEEVVGTRLVERTRGHANVQLTPAGTILIEHADAIVARLTAARSDLERMSIGEAGLLRVGLCETAATLVLPDMLPLLRHRAPNLEVTTVEVQDWVTRREMVARGELDVAFDYLPVEDGPLEHVDVLSSPCVLLVQADSPLARRDAPPTLAEIARLPLVEHPVWRFAPRLRVILQATGRAPRFSARSDFLSGVTSLVAAGMGAAVLPATAVDPERTDVVAIDLTDVLPMSRLALLWHRDRRTLPLETFQATAREVGARFEVGSRFSRLPAAAVPEPAVA